MPASTIHRCIGRRILEIHPIFTSEKDKYYFELGCIAPDSWKDSNRFKYSQLPKKDKRKYSHFSPDDKYIELYLDYYNKYKSKINDPFMLGYLVHLMTDFFWRYLIFYNYFTPNGSVMLLNGTTINGEKGVRKQLLKAETKKICTVLSKYYKLNTLRRLSYNELLELPKIDEIEFDGLNHSISFANKESFDQVDYILRVYSIEDFKNGIDRISYIILGELVNLKIIEP